MSFGTSDHDEIKRSFEQRSSYMPVAFLTLPLSIFKGSASKEAIKPSTLSASRRINTVLGNFRVSRMMDEFVVV